MEKESLQRKYYLSEFSHHDGNNFITFNIVDICTVRNEIAVAVTDEGKITIRKFDLKLDGEFLYFEYGMTRGQIAVDNFEQVNDTETN